jgi:hypothetical protein|tara:strand:+ start:6367 stop:6783 length:417 start_codon:yes stop_codon:yes gene_type:complete
MGVVDEKLRQAPEGGKYIKADEFINGLKLKVVSFGVVKADSPKYGASEKDGENSLFDQKKLAEGETFKYEFVTAPTEEEMKDPNYFPETRIVNSKSLSLFIPFSQLNPEVNDVLWIQKSGSGESTRYTVDFYRNQDNG